MILAGGAGTRLGVLSDMRAKPAVPFAGKFRIIDFPISNCVNSGIYDVAVLTQYQPRSLNEHIGIGKPWDLDRARGGIRLLHPRRMFVDCRLRDGRVFAARTDAVTAGALEAIGRATSATAPG
jgi:ADP-glucose pyrophosphorylase